MWSVWIDRGGTFTDAIAHDRATGALRTAKLPSGDDSILAAVRALFADQEVPAIELRLGTTLATNALLERRGARTALAITRGFGDLLAIGDQTRPALFALDLVKPAPLVERVLEVEARAAADGTVLAVDDEADLFVRFSDLVADGLESLAVVVMHGHAAPALEDAIAQVARRAGLAHVTTSHEVGVTAGLLARAETAVVDAYLTPVIASALTALARVLPQATIAIMTSAGGLVDAAHARGRDVVVSGPAGGAIATAASARAAAAGLAIGFDMGGTSTDVTAIVDELAFDPELVVGGLRVRAPAIAIHTVAAGGGSIGRFDGLALSIGPDSAGAVPGPICYARGGREVTVTDCDLILGRLADDHFPWRLDRAGAEAALATMGAGLGGDAARAAIGLFEIANARMAEAVRAMTIERGHDARDFLLIGFGGAAGMHACAVAAALGITAIRIPPHAGLRSAWGIGHAARTWRASVDGAGGPLTDATLAGVARDLDALAATAPLTDATSTRRTADLRFRGSDTTLTVALADVATMTAAAIAAHRARFGFARDAAVELVAAHVELHAPTAPARLARRAGGPTPPPRRTTRVWSVDAWHEAPVWSGDDLPAGAVLDGPALILDRHATLVVDAGWRATVLDDGTVALAALARTTAPRRAAITTADPVLLEIHGHRFMAIAEQMGAMLERTAVSVNIRERRDFSCAIFDADGDLVANAPHVPVHLGAMGETVRALFAAHPAPPPGTSYACNDPWAGGSHLPDLTVVTPPTAPTAGSPSSSPTAATTPTSAGSRRARCRLTRRRWPTRAWSFVTWRSWRAASSPRPRCARSSPVAGIQPGCPTTTSPICARSWPPTSPARACSPTGSAPAQAGNLNAPRAVTVAAALYVVRALVDAPIPLNAGCLRAVELVVPPGSILDPPPGAAVVAGNVETSQRIGDVVLGALGLAAASQGTMNNLTIGGADWAYYETIAGGAGATARGPGADAVHTQPTPASPIPRSSRRGSRCGCDASRSVAARAAPAPAAAATGWCARSSCWPRPRSRSWPSVGPARPSGWPAAATARWAAPPSTGGSCPDRRTCEPRPARC